MAATFKVKLDGRFYKEAKGRIERFHFDVGVLEDKPYYKPLTANQARKRGYKGGLGNKQGPLNKILPAQAKAIGGLKQLAGGPARIASRRKSGLSLSQVSERLRKETGINFYTRPWKSKRGKDLVRFIQSFMRMITQGGKLAEKKRLENALQAVVRNPIVRGDYGRNARSTAKTKGFNRLMIDTGQLFKGIMARVRVNKRV